MSWWCTRWSLADDEHAEDCPRWVECGCGHAFAGHPGLTSIAADCRRHWVADPRISCRCGPVRYPGSVGMPDQDMREGWFDLAHLASHIGPDGHDRPEAGTHVPLLRVSLEGSRSEPNTVLLDRAQVVELADELTDWLAGCDEET
jgi:hypothetical protein